MEPLENSRLEHIKKLIEESKIVKELAPIVLTEEQKVLKAKEEELALKHKKKVEKHLAKHHKKYEHLNAQWCQDNKCKVRKKSYKK